MTTRRQFRIPSRSAIAFALGVIVVCGCSDDKKPTGPDDGWPSELRRPDSPEDVLYNLQQAYRRKNTAWYDSLLYDAEAAGDTVHGFFFEFHASDPSFPSWSRSQDVAATAKMFQSPRVEDITVDLTYEPAVPVTEAGCEGQKEILVGYVYLNVEDRDPDDGTVTEYRAAGCRAHFRFKPQWFPASGDTLWRVVHWRDLGYDRAGASAAP
jgi:hypothetical protein